MTIRPTRTATLLTAALVASTFAFAPAPAPAASAVPAGDIAAATVIDGQPVTTVRGLADRTGFLPGESPTDLVSWMRANRRIIEASGLSTFAATDACAPLSPTDAGVAMDCDEPEPGEGYEEEFSWSYVDTTGDLDGDGWDEVLEITVTFDEAFTETTAVRSGQDGAELWTNVTGDEGGEMGYSFLVSAPDLDGDGGEDLLRVALSFDREGGESCSPIRCEYHESFSDSTTLTALRGATGEELGGVTFDVSVAYQDTFTHASQGPLGLVAYDGSYEVVGGLTGLDFVDVDGDGAHQLLLGTVDVSGQSSGAYGGLYHGGDFNDLVAGRSQVEASGEVTLHDLTTGERTVVRAEQDALLYPIGAVLDGADAIVVDRFPLGTAADLYACVFADTPGVYDCGSSGSLLPNDDAATRMRLDGDLAAVWTAPANPYSLAVFEAGGDLDGDGRDDLLDVVIDFDAWELATEAISGADGGALWTAPIVGGVVDDGDLLGVSFRYEEQYDEETYEVTISADGHRLDGATGAPLAQRELGSVTEFERDGLLQFGWLGVSVAQLDGDGLDLATEATTYLLEEVSREEYCYEEEWDGEVYEYCDVWIEYDLVSAQGAVTGSDGATFDEIFTRDVSSAWLAGLLDVDGDGRDDLLLEEFDDETGQASTVAERVDGTLVWELVDAFVGGVIAAGDGWSLVTYDMTDGSTVIRDASDLSERWRIQGVGAGVVVVVDVVTSETAASMPG